MLGYQALLTPPRPPSPRIDQCLPNLHLHPRSLLTTWGTPPFLCPTDTSNSTRPKQSTSSSSHACAISRVPITVNEIITYPVVPAKSLGFIFSSSLSSLHIQCLVILPPDVSFLLINLFIYSFLAALGLRCCTRAFSSCGERGLLFVAVHGLLIAVASLVAEHGL